MRRIKKGQKPTFLLVSIPFKRLRKTRFVQLQKGKQISRTFQEHFKDKLQFSRAKIYSINQRSLIPFWTPYWLKHVMKSFTIFNSSAMVDHIIFYYFPQKRFGKWLDMNCNCIWGTEIANKETEVRYCSCIKIFFWQGT